MIPQWDDIRQRFETIAENIPIYKFNYPTKTHPRYGQKVEEFLETSAGRRREAYYGIKKCLMPLPSAVLAFPMFR